MCEFRDSVIPLLDGITRRNRFAVTNTLKLRDLDSDVQFDGTHADLVNKVCKTFGKFTCVAELTQNADVHYHGMIEADMSLMVATRKFAALFRADKRFGFVSVKLVDNEPGWCEYLRKSVKETKEALDRPPILIDHFDVFKDWDSVYCCDLDPQLGGSIIIPPKWRRAKQRGGPFLERGAKPASQTPQKIKFI